MKFINVNSSEQNSKEYLQALYQRLETLCDVLGIIIEKKEEILDSDIEALIAERQAARKEKNFARADEIRYVVRTGDYFRGYQRRSKMEKGIDAYIKEQFHLPPVDIRTYSPLTLAYIGDGIYDLIIRSIIVGKGNTKASRLHQETSKLVRAQAQSEMIDLLLPYLSEEETDIYRRGRNAKSPTMAKNATMTDYRKATGFEALMGYLYLKDEFERMVELIKIALGEEEEGKEQTF